VQFSFISIILLAAAVIVGPVGAGIVGMVSTLVQLGKAKFIVRLFNVAMFTCMATIGALAYTFSRGAQFAQHQSGAGDLLLRVGLPLMVAEVAQCITNAVLLALILRVASGVPMRMQAWKLLSTTGLAYIGYGVIGFLFVVLWIPAGVGPFSAVLVLAPLFVARWAFVQYGDELRAHERTLRALVTAEETKEPHNAGHSERVAQLCEWLGEMLGLGHKEIQDVRTAGMLHDIGKVGVPSRLLRARNPLTDEDHAAVAEHAVMGVELVRGIDFLAGSVDGIAHHHERFDGRGYPTGLAGEAIPLSARIVAVADVFDCLTTSRPYRAALTVPDALDVLQSRAGSQFDPHVVETLGRVLVRHPWEPLERSEQMLATAGVALDHDEPEVSDLLAARADLRRRLRHTPRGVAEPVGGRS
jgi:putative nucleotidyltransferase with HDIG domain